MLSVLDIIKKTTVFFAAKGLDTPRLDAELLISHALGLKRMQLYLQFERLLTEGELEKIRPSVRRRAAREPLQHITGEVEWGGLKLKVDRRALIPRPETELLLQLALEARAAPENILDLGTGAGALALALASARPSARVTAIDSSAAALALARENAAALGPAGGRVLFLESDWFAALSGGASVPAGEKFDLIVSNPPYLTAAEYAGAQPEVRQYEPRAALVPADDENGANDGCADLLKIIRGAVGFLKPGGVLALETGIAQHATLLASCAASGYARCESRKDHAARDRFVLAWPPP